MFPFLHHLQRLFPEQRHTTLLASRSLLFYLFSFAAFEMMLWWALFNLALSSSKRVKNTASVVVTAWSPMMKNIERSTNRQTGRQTDVHLQQHLGWHACCIGENRLEEQDNASMPVKVHTNTQSQQETEVRAVLHNTTQRRLPYSLFQGYSMWLYPCWKEKSTYTVCESPQTALLQSCRESLLQTTDVSDEGMV